MGDTMSLSNSEWKETKWGTIATLEYGKGLSNYDRIDGKFPVYGTNGKIGTTDNYLCPFPSIIIGRKGAYRGVHYSKTPFYVIDTAFYLNPLIEDLDMTFAYYHLLTVDINYMDSGSAIPSTTREDFYDLDIKLPPLPEQKTIASILSSLDDKIDLLHRQNKTLEALAETLFRQWFAEDKIWDGKLSEYIKIQGGYAFKSQDLREVGFAGIIKITNISMGSVDIINTQYVDEDVVKKIEEEKFRARPGDFLIAMTGAEIGKIGMIEQTKKQIWVNQRVGKLVEKVPLGNIVGYLALKSREGQEHIINTCSGSAQENISSSGIEEMDFVKYSPKIVEKFGTETKPLFEKILFNKNQIRTLTQLRDTLLPKLMSGEVRVRI
jgi:type I restriction enzyme S subunit